jgi:excisionase family DNA binding protein
MPRDVAVPKSRALPALSFTRAEWPSVTGLPLKTCDELVAIGAIKSIKIGRRRLFRLQDVEAWFSRLARSGHNLQPRQKFLAHRRALKAKARAA